MIGIEQIFFIGINSRKIKEINTLEMIAHLIKIEGSLFRIKDKRSKKCILTEQIRTQDM